VVQARDGSPTVGGSLMCPRPVPEPELRLFLLHHAGGSHLLFREWVPHFPATWEVWFVETPGHGRLAALDPLTDAESAVSFVVEDLREWVDRPFALLGHSMGAVLAYELAHRLPGHGLPMPRWLALSACGGPLPDGRLEVPRRHLLPGDELRRAVAGFGGTPEEVLDDDDYWSFLEPVLRADFQLVETWRAPTGSLPSEVPVAVFGGENDVSVRKERLAAWSERAEHFLGLHLFPGAHFYFRENLTRFVATVVAEAEKAEYANRVR
jgi:surfactin synthase thioesterase subunit